MLAYGSMVLYWGSSILYSPRIWQKGSLASSLLHQLGRRVWLFSKILSMYASRICYQEKMCNEIELAICVKQRRPNNLILTVNSVTCIEMEIGPKTPASLYISRIKATHVVDFPSLYTHSSCSGMVSNWSKDMPRFSISSRIPWRSKSW